jgi:ABC-type multidrug transport system fused ATPase/permease subunit
VIHKLGVDIISVGKKLQTLKRAFRCFFFFFTYLHPHRFKVIYMSLFLALATATGMCLPLVAKFLVDEVIPKREWQYFWCILVGYVGVSTVLQALSLLQGYIGLLVRNEINVRLATDYYDHLLHLPYKTVRQYQSGTHVCRATTDIESIVSLLSSFFISSATNLLSLVLAVSILFSLNWQVTLIFIAFIPIAFLFRMYMSLKVRPLEFKMGEHQDTISGFLGESISAIKEVKICNMENRQSVYYEAIVRDKMRSSLRLWRLNTSLDKVRMFLESGTGFVLQWWIWFLVMRGTSSLGTAMAIAWYFSSITGPVMGLTGSIQRIISGMVPGERVLRILSCAREREIRDGVRITDKEIHAVKFSNVSFSYDENVPVLKDVSFELRQGELNMLAGPSGTGKTTTINLLCALYDGYKGSITFNDIPLENIETCSLRRLVRLVPQDPFIFEDTIFNNIAYGTADCTFDDVVRVAKHACIHERILQLPDGYDTVVGSGDQDLSGGERQRLCVARVLLSDAPVLLIDEGFSNLDAETESAIISTLKREYKSRIILLITHNKDTILAADRLYVMTAGSIAPLKSPETMPLAYV